MLSKRQAMVAIALGILLLGFEFEVKASFKPTKPPMRYEDCTQTFVNAGENGYFFQFEYKYKKSWFHYFVKPAELSNIRYKPIVKHVDPGPSGKYRDSLSNFYCWQIEDCTMNPTDPYLCIKSYSEKYQNYYWYNDKGDKGPFLAHEGMTRGVIIKKHPKFRFKIRCLGGCGNEQLSDCDIMNERDPEDAVYVKRNKWLYMKGKCLAFRKLVHNETKYYYY